MFFCKCKFPENSISDRLWKQFADKSVCEVTRSLSRGQIPDRHKSAHDLQLISCINFCTMGKFKLCGADDLRSADEQATEFQKNTKGFLR
jgi:hypothetical protein